MNKLLLTIFLLASTTLVFSSDSAPDIIHTNEIDILIFSNDKVQVYQDKDHMFGIDCKQGIMCSAFVTDSIDNKFKIMDGIAQVNDKVLALSVKSVKSVLNKKDDLVFILSTGNATGTYANIQKFLIDTETGAFSKITTKYDWLRYGHPLDYPLEN
jgi:hypothetical protein